MAGDLLPPFIVPESWNNTAPGPEHAAAHEHAHDTEYTERRLRPRIRTSNHSNHKNAPTCADPVSHGGECDCTWAENQLALVPPAFRQIVQRKYNAIKSRAGRNTWLRRLTDAEPAPDTATEAEKRALARLQAGARFQPAPLAWTSDPDVIPKITKHIDLSRHMTDLVGMSDTDIKTLAKDLASKEEIWLFSGVREAVHHHRLEPRLRRYLRKAARQKKEMWALSLGIVGSRSWQNRAVSNMTLQHREQQLEAQAEWASRTKVTLEGIEIELSKIISQSKKNRFAEIVTITKGLEQAGKAQGLQAVFITLTAPPRFHPNPEKGGNSWDGSTPEMGKRWLIKEWANTRSRLAKKWIYTPGVRNAEAHKDACPHLHMMIWVEPDQVNAVETEFRKSQGWDVDAGAKFVVIDESQGKASSYILKYIMKTLKGEESDRDDAWRATWGVRAIQFFGIPTLALWRTLRKSKPEEVLNADPSIAAARAAAQNGNYAAFLELTGGLNIKKADRPIQMQTEKIENATIKKIFSFETLAIIIARAKATLTTIIKSKVTVKQNYPRKPKTQNQKPQNPASPPPSTAPPILNFVLA